MPRDAAASKPEWTLADLRSLPPTVPARQADSIIGMSISTGKRLRAEGAYPVPWVSIGRHHRVLTAPLLAFLGLRVDDLSDPAGTMPAQAAVDGVPQQEGAA